MATRPESLAESLERLAHEQPQGVDVRPVAPSRPAPDRTYRGGGDQQRVPPRRRTSLRSAARGAGAALGVLAAVALVVLGLAWEFLGDGSESRWDDGELGFLGMVGMFLVPMVLFLVVRTGRVIYEHWPPWRVGGRRPRRQDEAGAGF